MNNWIDKIFNIEVANIKFKKPRIKVNNLKKFRIKQLLKDKSRREFKYLYQDRQGNNNIKRQSNNYKSKLNSWR